MSKEDPYRDQAERLRQRIEKINENPLDDTTSSSLPPRSDMHRYKKKKTKWKMKYPIIRILVLFFILMPITIYSIYSYLDGKKLNKAEKASVSTQGFETINFEKPAKETKQIKKLNSDKANQSSSDKTVTNNGDEGKSKDTQNNAESGQNTSALTTPTASSANKPNVQQSTKNGSGQTTPAPTKKQDSYKIIYHTVKPQETLYRISMEYYGSDEGIDIIKQANHIQNEGIQTGQVLKIPIKK
ncbi:MAG: LysM peptidoglycan-binding domain-containing protein [Bacillota bacterium]|nr:LysM peptidoglycan-binding domain-containing protein [Bacillota bacterium]